MNPLKMPDSSSRLRATDSGGSSKLDLPTTQQPGSSVRVDPANSSRPAQRTVADQPTAISKQPPIEDPGRPTPSRVLAQSLIGTNLMHFQVEKFVGGGGMGAVFRGRDTTLGRTVAIKVLSQEHIDEDIIRRFRHEAESAARLDHPGIPHVYFLGEQDEWYFIVFEFIEGQNIRDYVAQQGPLSIPQAIVYLADVADALQHASSREVVHRDIKPSNMLITNDGHAKLVDMGLARTEQIQSTANDLTATGVTLGTFDYISPEQAKDPRNADTRSDIYSLGCTLYFMLVGTPPFPEGTMLQKLLSHTSEAPPDPSGFRNDIPPRMTQLLSRMLAKDPEHRFQEVGELLGEILMLAEEQNVKLNNARATNVIVKPQIIRESGLRRHIPWLVPLAILIATSVGLQAWNADPTPAPDVSEAINAVQPQEVSDPSPAAAANDDPAADNPAEDE